jgi:hypothetical protein
MSASLSDTGAWNDCGAPRPAIGEEVRTACGGVVRYSLNTPCIQNQNEMVFFCLPICLDDCEKDPQCACLAAQKNQ